MFEAGYSKKSVCTITAFIFFLDILINVDHGALPAAAVAIKEDLKLPNVQFGTLGSLVFLGLMSGSIFATFIVNKI